MGQQITHIPMAVSFERFCELSYQLTGDLMEVPQLGLKAKTALEHEGIRSTHQLLARWLEVRKSANAQARFKEWLDVKGAPRTHSGRIASSIAERVAKVGIKLQVELSEQIVKSSRIDDDKARAIASRTFNNILEHDFQGCGFGSPDKPSAAVDALRLAGIDSTDKLFAAFLKKFDSAPTSEKATEFWSDLGKIEGFKAHGYKSSIVEALKIRLENGIDCPRVISRHQPTLAPVAEPAAEPVAEPVAPRTPPAKPAAFVTTPMTGPGQEIRTVPLRQRAGIACSPQGVAACSPQGMACPQSSLDEHSGVLTSTRVILLGGVVLAAAAYFQWSMSSSTELVLVG